MKWRSLSIRIQLILLLAILLAIVQFGSLGVTYWFDIKERKTLAVEQAETLGRSLNHDLLKAILNPQADSYADIAFRLSGFHSVSSLSILDQHGKQIYQYHKNGKPPEVDAAFETTGEPYFSQDFLYLRQSLDADGYSFGLVDYVIDLSSYKTRLDEHLLTLIFIFPLELMIGLLMAWWISRTYTLPFTELAVAMQDSDVEENRFQKVSNKSKNELGILYDGYNSMVRHIEKKTSELIYLSEHDSLTGLYNRYAVEKNIANHLKLDSVDSHVLMLMDLDRFKLINDAVGHVAGDELLKQISLICQQVLPDNTMIGRVGGDDFYILLPATTEEIAINYARSLLTRLQDYRFVWESGEFNVSASIGMVSFCSREYTMAALVTAVDTAFYAAKTKGRNQLHIYRHDDNRVQQYNEDIQISSIISEALQGGPANFELYAQDIVPLQYSTDELSYEILLRMRDSHGELCMPGQFLPTAERYQLMTEIDTHVLWKYLETVCGKHEHLEKLAFVNINLAGASLNHPDFQHKLRAAIDKFDFPWSKLVLEVTETSAVGNLLMASDFIRYCRDSGIRVALDDFGTGMASFEYLKQLPFDVVKIDGSFVRDMLVDPVDNATVSYVHNISKLRQQETIAEFIENEEHLQALKEIGIDYGQGYHLGKPRPLSEWL